MHGGPPPQRASGMREGTRAVKEPPRGMEGAGQSESMDRKEEGSKEVQTAGGGVRSGGLAS